jgi:hypothetical protein
MATLEITIADESKLDSIISMLKEFGDVNIGKIQLGAKKTKKKAKINWTDEKLDPATHALVLDSIERRKRGDTSHLIQVNDIKEIFYDL